MTTLASYSFENSLAYGKLEVHLDTDDIVGLDSRVIP